MRTCRPSLLSAAAAIGLAAALAASTVSAAESDYARDIRPLLKSRCYACHGALKQEAGLRLDTVAAMHTGGDEGDILKPDDSLLIEKIAAAELTDRMPPEGAPLTASQISAIKAWVAAGSPAPPDDQPEPDPRSHWSFQKPKSAPLPEAPPEWNTTPVDRLLHAHYSAAGLTPQPEAPRSLWLRRVYFDTIGLPPSPDEITAFEADRSEGAIAAVVDRLLASPQFGERWARHFMDIWRYSDWWGLDAQLRYSQKHIWHWRDWIIESLNTDRGCDRMVQEMLAADELAPDDRSALRATGFLCRPYYLFNRTTWLDEVIEHTSRAFLGITMQCSKCHDHKYDPVSQTDYYRLRAVFEPYHVRLDALPGETDFERDGLPRAFDLHPEKVTHLHRRGDEKQPDTSRAIEPGIPAIFGNLTVNPVTLPPAAWSPGLMEHVFSDHLAAAEKDIAEARKAVAADPASIPAQRALTAALLRPAMLRTARDAAAAEAAGSPDRPALVRTAAAAAAQWKLATAESADAAAEAALNAAAPDKKSEAEKKRQAAAEALTKARAAAGNPGDQWDPLKGALKALEGPDDSFDKNPAVYPSTSTGRRLAFARWLTSTENPLTARVFINHLWTRTVGESFVPDVSDFGRRCPPPALQDVLDSLATDFMAGGWKIKPVLRTILTSRLYRSASYASGAPAATLSADPENHFLWRFPAKRLESQAVRDGILHLSGILDPQQGGPPVPIPSGENSHRRAIYLQQHGELEDRFLGTFDNASVFDCYRRRESVTPQQALALTNSRLSRECADALAGRLTGITDDSALIRTAFLTILCRQPSDSELAAAQSSLTELRAARPNGSAALSRALFIQALMSHNDFVTVR